MATYVEGRSAASDAEPVGLLSEGAAGIAAIVLAVIALAGISSGTLAAITTIVIGVGLMAQAFNSAAEAAKLMPAGAVAGVPAEMSSEVMVDCLTGIAGIILGILALVGINAAHLVPAALIVFGGALLLDGGIGMRPRAATTANTTAGAVQIVSLQRRSASSRRWCWQWSRLSAACRCRHRARGRRRTR